MENFYQYLKVENAELFTVVCLPNETGNFPTVIFRSPYVDYTDLFYSIFKGHQNAFYLYGHVHGERACYRENTSGAILHINADNQPISNNINESNSIGKDFAYTFVHMGGLRPFGAKYFNNDGLVGFGGLEEAQYQISTGTPKLSQYLVFEVYEDRVVFNIRNTGDFAGYSQQDKLRE